MAHAQVMIGEEMSLSRMTQAQMTRVEVKDRLAAATPDAPADFKRGWLNGLDLSGLDFNGSIQRAASPNDANL